MWGIILYYPKGKYIVVAQIVSKFLSNILHFVLTTVQAKSNTYFFVKVAAVVMWTLNSVSLDLTSVEEISAFLSNQSLILMELINYFFN